MASNVVNQSPYLRTSREFPVESAALSTELTRTYTDIAEMVNQRAIGIYTATRPSVTGCTYFIVANKKQQVLRQVYPIPAVAVAAAPTAISHGLSVAQIERFLPSCAGAYTDGTNWYGLSFGGGVAVAGLATFSVTATQIVFAFGATAPLATKGTVTLEWLSNP